MEKNARQTPDLTAQNVDKIAELFPSCVTQTQDETGALKKAVNFDALKQALSGSVIEENETYEFTWVGKKAAAAEAFKPCNKTLRPCPEESVDWDNTQNLFIEGDNLDALKLLRKEYLNKVKMIYIDPPYNTGNDFIYNDNFRGKSGKKKTAVREKTRLQPGSFRLVFDDLFPASNCQRFSDRRRRHFHFHRRQRN